MRTVLIVGHDRSLTRLIEAHLTAAGYKVESFDRGELALRSANHSAPDLILLDLRLPEENGFSILRSVRSNQSLCETRVIVVSAESSEADRITGLEMGADDYIVKPFSPRELVARVKAVLRLHDTRMAASVLECGALRADSAAMVVSMKGQVVPTTATEFRILEYLLRAAGRVVTREQLLHVLSSKGGSRKLDAYISRLRRKIKPSPDAPRYILTVRGIGYRFQPPDRTQR